MSETPEDCTKPWYEPCQLHPVDCPTCTNEPTCQMKADMQAHKDKIRRCRQYRRKPGQKTLG